MLNLGRLVNIAFFALALLSCSRKPDAELTLREPLPQRSPISGNQSRCDAQLSTGLYGNTLGQNEIKGHLAKGTDKISIQWEGETLYFLSGASFGLGEAKGAPFTIVKKSADRIVAISQPEGPVGETIDILMIDTVSGLGVWTKTRSDDMISGGNPSAQSFYLLCR